VSKSTTASKSRKQPSAPEPVAAPSASVSAYRSHARSITSRVVIGFRIDPGLKDSLHKKLRQRKMRSLSDLMETVVREWLDKQDELAVNTSR